MGKREQHKKRRTDENGIAADEDKEVSLQKEFTVSTHLRLVKINLKKTRCTTEVNAQICQSVMSLHGCIWKRLELPTSSMGFKEVQRPSGPSRGNHEGAS